MISKNLKEAFDKVNEAEEKVIILQKQNEMVE